MIVHYSEILEVLMLFFILGAIIGIYGYIKLSKLFLKKIKTSNGSNDK